VVVASIIAAIGSIRMPRALARKNDDGHVSCDTLTASAARERCLRLRRKEDDMPYIETALAERRVMTAVLLDALRVLYVGRRPGHRRQVWAWMSDAGDVGPFAFVTLCGALGLEPNTIRVTVRRNLAHRGRPLPPSYERAA
jgi:hypothetical protein